MSRRTLGASRRGASAVEFALTLPLLLAMLSGIMDLGWFFAQRHALVSAAAEGARAGAVTLQEDAPETAATDTALAAWASTGLPGAPEIVAQRVGSPEQMVVTISLDMSALIGLVPATDTIVVRSIKNMEDQP